MQVETQKKQIIHQVLNKHGFYRLHLQKLLEILRLLEEPEARVAKNIQDNTFNGLIKLTDVLKQPHNIGKIRGKKYFNQQIAQTITPEIKSFMVMIVDELLQSLKHIKSSKNRGKKDKPAQSPAPTYPFMQPPFDFTGSANSEQLSKEMEERMKMQMQMYYMNMFNYGTPQMNLTQPFTYPKTEPQEQPLALYQDMPPNGLDKEGEGVNQEMQRMQEHAMEKEHAMEQDHAMEQEHAMEKEQGLIKEEREVQVVIEGKANIDEEQMAAIQQKKKEAVAQKQVDAMMGEQKDDEIKSKKMDIEYHIIVNEAQASRISLPRSLPISPQKKEVIIRPPQKLNSSAKGNQIQIQTDLSLLNEEIQVFPKNRVVDEAALTEMKREQEDRRKTKVVKVPRVEEFKTTERKITSYIITVNRDYFIPNLKDSQPPPPPLLKHHSSQLFDSQFKEDLKALRPLVTEDYLRDCRCKGKLKQTEDTFQCIGCKRKFHYSCLRSSQPSQIEQCHICLLEKNDPINEVKETLGIFYISAALREKIEGKITIAQYEYFLSKKIRSHQLEMRSCRLGGSLELAWPEEVGVFVNEKLVAEAHGGTITGIKKGTLLLTDAVLEDSFERGAMLSQSSIGIDLHSLARESMGQVNAGLFYCVGVYFVEKIELQPLIQKFMKNIESCSVDFVANLMTIDCIDDNQLEIEKVVCSLYDPYTRSLMRTPVRGNKCHHGQCFDLKTFITLMYATKSRHWRCPICKKEARKFLLDPLFVSIIKRSLQDDTIPNDVTFTKEGKILLKIVKTDKEDDDDTPPMIKKIQKKARIKKAAERVVPAKAEEKPLQS